MIVEVYFPGTPATPGTPARYIELNGPSWSSGSVSIPLTPGEGGYKFQIPASVVGVFVGLATGYPGTGYFGIQHALYFSRGVVDVYESGQKVGSLGSYVSGDEFTLIRQTGRVWFIRNGVKEFDRPSRLVGTFRLASTQYLTGDKVVDAEVVGVGAVPTSGDGVARLRPLVAYGFETAPANWGVAELAPLTVTGSVDGHGWGTANLGALMTLGSDRPIAVGRATLAPLTSQAESGLIAPDFATGSSVVGPLQQVGRMIPGGIGAGLITTKLLALGSDRPIAQAHNELAPLFAWGAEGVGLRGGAMTLTGRFKVVASARRVGVSGAMLEGPSLALTAFGGGSAKIKLPRLTMSGAGTIPVVARADLTLPSLTKVALGGCIGGDGLQATVTGSQAGNGLLVTRQRRAAGQLSKTALVLGVALDLVGVVLGLRPVVGDATVGGPVELATKAGDVAAGELSHTVGLLLSLDARPLQRLVGVEEGAGVLVGKRLSTIRKLPALGMEGRLNSSTETVSAISRTGEVALLASQLSLRIGPSGEGVGVGVKG